MRYILRGLIVTIIVSLLFTTLRHAKSSAVGLMEYLPDISRPSWLRTSSSALAASRSALVSHYAPAENLERIDVELIEQSQDHLDVAMYALTDQAIAHALLDVASRGVHVRIYRDQTQYAEEQSRNPYIAHLLRGSRNIEIRVKGSRELMHLKAFANGTILRDGSANMSPSGEKRQDNSLVLTRDPDDIRAFETTFNAMWTRRDNYVIQ